MTRLDKTLRTAFLVLAGLALVGTQSALVRHIVDGGTISTALSDTVVNPAAVFVTIDLLVVAIVALIWMVAEARRLGMRRVWLYVVLTFTVAISVALPVFLAVRQRHLTFVRDAAVGGDATGETRRLGPAPWDSSAWILPSRRRDRNVDR